VTLPGDHDRADPAFVRLREDVLARLGPGRIAA
jgi:hypothetical protein